MWMEAAIYTKVTQLKARRHTRYAGNTPEDTDVFENCYN